MRIQLNGIKRVEAGGWVEEVFYSLLRIGFCYEQLANRSANKQNEVTDADEKETVKGQEEQYLALAVFIFKKLGNIDQPGLNHYTNLQGCID